MLEVLREFVKISNEQKFLNKTQVDKWLQKNVLKNYQPLVTNIASSLQKPEDDVLNIVENFIHTFIKNHYQLTVNSLLKNNFLEIVDQSAGAFYKKTPVILTIFIVFYTFYYLLKKYKKDDKQSILDFIDNYRTLINKKVNEVLQSKHLSVDEVEKALDHVIKFIQNNASEFALAVRNNDKMQLIIQKFTHFVTSVNNTFNLNKTTTHQANSTHSNEIEMTQYPPSFGINNPLYEFQNDVSKPEASDQNKGGNQKTADNSSLFTNIKIPFLFFTYLLTPKNYPQKNAINDSSKAYKISLKDVHSIFKSIEIYQNTFPKDSTNFKKYIIWVNKSYDPKNAEQKIKIKETIGGVYIPEFPKTIFLYSLFIIINAGIMDILMAYVYHINWKKYSPKNNFSKDPENFGPWLWNQYTKDSYGIYIFKNYSHIPKNILSILLIIIIMLLTMFKTLPELFIKYTNQVKTDKNKSETSSSEDLNTISKKLNDIFNTLIKIFQSINGYIDVQSNKSDPNKLKITSLFKKLLSKIYNVRNNITTVPNTEETEEPTGSTSVQPETPPSQQQPETPPPQQQPETPPPQQQPDTQQPQTQTQQPQTQTPPSQQQPQTLSYLTLRPSEIPDITSSVSSGTPSPSSSVADFVMNNNNENRG
jgi:hypothetical protein